MKLVAPAPRIGINFNLSTRNLILALMCAAFCFLFIRDGFFAYPAINDEVMRKLRDGQDVILSQTTRDRVEKWTRWNDETAESRKAMNRDIEDIKNEPGGRAKLIVLGVRSDGKEDSSLRWKQPFDVTLQRWLALALVAANVWSISRLVRFLRKRTECDDATLSPRRGLVIPWERISQVDNTDWRASDIVEITYSDEAGASQKALLDGYEVDKGKLVPILEQLAEKAVHAEFLPKEEEKMEAPADEAPKDATGN